MSFGRSHVCVLGGNPPPREPQRNMNTIKAGSYVQMIGGKEVGLVLGLKLNKAEVEFIDGIFMINILNLKEVRSAIFGSLITLN